MSGLNLLAAVLGTALVLFVAVWLVEYLREYGAHRR